MCAAERRAGEVTQAPWRSPENHGCILDNWVLFILLECDFCFVQIMSVLLFSLEIRKHLT